MGRFVTAAEAATELGVSRRRIAELWHDGSLRGEKLASGDLSVDLESVHERALLAPPPGRPWSEAVVWDIVSALSGSITATAEAARRVRRADPSTLGRRIAAAVVVRRFDGRRPEAVESDLLLTGPSALDVIESSRRPRVTGQRPLLHGYPKSTIDALIADHGLVESPEGGILIHGFRSGARLVRDATPVALVAADCLRSLDARIRRVGLTALDEMRTEWMNANG